MIIRRPGDSPPPGQRGRAIPAIIEKRLAKYVHLECDHYTTYETIIQYVGWRGQKQKGRYFCENCGQWKKLYPKPKREKISQEPLF